MYPISESAKARFLSGQKQIARLTVVNDGYEPYAGETYNTEFKTNVVWNQKLKDAHFANSTSPKWRGNASLGTFAIANNKATYTITVKSSNQSIVQDSVSFTQGHVYLTSFWITTSESQVIGTYTGNTAVNFGTVTANTRTRIVGVFTSSVTSTRTHYVYCGRQGGISVGGTAILEDCCLYDLTAMFGEGKEYLGYKSFFNNFTENYYDYNESGNTVPFTWTVYGGSLNAKTGVLTITHSRYEFTGTEGWTLQSGSTLKYWSNAPDSGYLVRDAKLPANNNSSVPIRTDIGDFNIAYNNLQNNQYSMCIASDSRIGIHSTLYSGQGTLEGIGVVYELATAVTFQLSPAEVRTLLGYNNIYAGTGSVNLSYRNTSGEVVAKSGDMVSIDDGAKNIPLASLSLPLLPKQDLHGYDYPWVGGGGKNICPNILTSQEISGITFTVNSDGTIKATGKATALVVFNITDGWHPINVKANVTYSVSGCPSGGSTTTFNLRITTTPSGSGTICDDYGSGQSFTPTSDNTYGCRLIIRSGYECPTGGILFKPQVEASASPTSYAPYENICPITGYTEANVTRTGKNLFDLNYLTATGITIADGVASGTASAFNSAFGTNAGGIPNVKIPSGKITLSCDAYTGGEQEASTDNGLWFGFHYTNGTTNCIKFKNNTTSWTHDSVTSNEALTVDFIVVTFANKPNNIWHLKNIQLQSEAQTVANLVINEDKIIEGGLSVNRYCTTGKAVMVGSCVASEMDVILNNEDGSFNDVNFIGKDIKVEVGTIDENDTPDYIPLGYFQVDDSPKKLAHISLTTLDRMMLLEKTIDATKLAFPMTVNALFGIICTECGVTPVSGLTILNGTYEIEAYPDTAETYRDLLSYIAEISGTCAYFDYNGELRLEWFNTTPAVELNVQNRTASDLSEESVIITGVDIKVDEGDYMAGSDGFLLTIAQNPLITHDYQSVADSLYTNRGNFTYRPFTATVLPMPYLYPLDTATFVDKNGNESVVAITDWTFRLNRNTELRGRGESTLQASFKKKYGLTEGGVSVDDAIGLLRDTIIKNAEIINQSMEELSRTLHGEYEAISSEFGTYRNETDAKITANAEGITQAYSNIEEIDSKYGVAVTDANQTVIQLADGAVAYNTKFRELTEAYIKSGKLYYEGSTPIYGVAVGQLTYEQVGDDKLIKRQGVYSVFTSEELAFYVDDVKVAYMRNKKLYINEAEFVAKVKVGNFAIEDGANGFTIK